MPLQKLDPCLARYALGDIVYLKVRSDKIRGMVTGIKFYPGGCFYSITWGNGNDSAHYGLELSTEYVAEYV